MYRFTRRMTTSVAKLFLVALFVYLLWCDSEFFTKLRVESTQLLGSNATNVPSKFSIKLRMLPPLDHYVYLPACRWVNKRLGISEIPGVTPNTITFLHFCIAVFCGKLFASASLSCRRFACIAFEFRTFLDVLDGVIYRAQSDSKTFVSGWGSWGYIIDGTADVLGSLFIMVGVIYRYNKNPPLKDRSVKSKRGKSADAVEVESALNLSSQGIGNAKRSVEQGSERHTRKHAIAMCLFMIVTMVMRSKMWDYFTQTYHELLGVPRADVSSRRQLEVLNYPSTWLCMWLWRFNSADAFLTLSLIFIFFDKLWPWLKICAYAALPNLLILGSLCQFHAFYVENCLGL